MTSRSVLFIAGVALAAGAPAHHEAQAQAQAQAQAPARPAIEPQADALLHRMCATLADQQAFRFNVSHVMEVVTKQGEKIQNVAESTVSVQRPNHLRVDRQGPAGGATVFYDGSTLSVYGKRDNLYATTKAPSSLDATIDFARDELALDAPGADLLYSDPYTALTEDAVSGRYLGIDPVGNRMCHHLAFRGHETDWQLWIEDGPRALPCRYVIVSKHVIRSPQYAIALSNWNLAPELSAALFTFRPPPDAGKIDFAALKDVARESAQTQARR